MDKNLLTYLKKYNINYKIHEHPPVFTVSQSIKLKLQINCLHTKNLFLKDEKGRFYLVCMAAYKRLNIKKLEEHLKVKKLKFSSSEELKKELNLPPGSVSIFGMIYAKNTHLLMDKEVYSASSSGFHPNINTATLEIDRVSLEKFYNSLSCSKEVINIG